MTGLYSVSWAEHAKDRTSSVKDMLERQSFVDVTLACDDDQLQAHKVLLSAASPFFQRILERNPHAHPLLYLRGALKKDVAAILNFIYEGEAAVPVQDFESFMSLAKDLEVKGLVDEIESIENKPTDRPIKDAKKPSESRKKDVKRKKAGPVFQEKKEEEHIVVEEDIKPKLEDLRNNLDMEVEEVELEQHLEQIMTDDLTLNHEITPKSNIEEQGLESSNDSELVDNDFSGDNLQEAAKDSGDKVVDGMTAKVNSLLVTTPDGFFVCNECRYGSKSEVHVREHIEMHIEGFAHKCKTCSRVFTKRTSFKFHVAKCQKK